MQFLTKTILAACVLALPLLARAADWPQFRGPDRSGVSPEKGLLSSWPKQGPKLAWTFANAGTGYAGMAVVGGQVYTMGAREGTELVLALDATGKERWSAKIAPVFDFKINTWSGGPNATPTVDGDRLYALGSQGELVCVQVKDGKEVWRKNLPRELGAEINNVQSPGPEKWGWGFCWSPLVDGDQLVCVPGGPQGLFAALDKKTGKVLWRSKDVTDQATYSSPMLATIGGVRQYVQLIQDGVVGVAAKDGALLWRFKREPYPDVVIPTPVVQGNKVYMTAWGGGCDLLDVMATDGKFSVKAVYSQQEISNRQGGVVLLNGFLYGFHELRAWECQEFATGEIKWAAGRRGLGYGAVSAADGHLYIVTEKGEVGLVEANPEKYTQKGRFKLPRESKLRKVRGGVWTYPSIADGLLYVRDQDLIFCYRIK